MGNLSAERGFIYLLKNFLPMHFKEKNFSLLTTDRSVGIM